MATFDTARRVGSQSSRYVCGHITYSTSTSNTAVTISVSKYELYHSYGWKDSFTFSYWTSGTLQDGDSHISQSASVTNKQYTGAGYTQEIGSASASFKRAHEAYTIRLNGRMLTHSTNYDGGVDITVPALDSYAVSYNANGGSGTIANDTKWYGENLMLSDGSGFTRQNYTLVGWNTASDGSGTHYALSDTYTGNDALTLYAEWVLNAVTAYAKVNGAIKQGICYTKINGVIKILTMGYAKVSNWKHIT